MRDERRNTDVHDKPLTKEKKQSVQTGRDIDTSNPAPGSMSEGNLTNDRFGREKTRNLHDKTFVTGTDRDGQAE